MTSLYHYDRHETVRQLRADLAAAAVASLDQAFAAPKGFYVYCLWGEDSECPLYVGKSANIFNRLGQHASNCFGRGTGNGMVTRVTLLRCETREIMDHVEVELIARFRPDCNHAQKPRTADVPNSPPPMAPLPDIAP